VLLNKLRTDRAPEGWTEFLAVYSDQIYKTTRLTTADEETAADCYLFIRQQLSQKNFKRLLRFRPEGPAKFETRLGVVAHNLCFDWLRSRYGRRSVLRALERLTEFENEVFRLHAQQGMSLGETLAHFMTRNAHVTLQQVEAADARIQQA
jgi:DNA-directed RNA polymerase specialized sigma24 family protein